MCGVLGGGRLCLDRGVLGCVGGGVGGGVFRCIGWSVGSSRELRPVGRRCIGNSSSTRDTWRMGCTQVGHVGVASGGRAAGVTYGGQYMRSCRGVCAGSGMLHRADRS